MARPETVKLSFPIIIFIFSFTYISRCGVLDTVVGWDVVAYDRKRRHKIHIILSVLIAIVQGTMNNDTISLPHPAYPSNMFWKLHIA